MHSNPSPSVITRYEARALHEAQAHVVSAYKAGIQLQAPSDEIFFSMSHASSPRMSVGRIKYGAEVEVQVESLSSFYQVDLTLAGAVRATQRGVATKTHGMRTGVVLDPSAPFTVQYGANAEQFALMVPCRSLTGHLASLLGHSVDDLDIDPVIDLASPHGETLIAATSQLHSTMERLNGHRGVELVRVHLESLVLTSLLLSTKHAFHDVLGDARPTVRRAQIREAVEYIEGNASLPITVMDVAHHVFVGVRALQIGFQEELGMSPTAYLREVRLQRTYHDIAESGGTSSIAEIACRWGFTHLGRFAQSYRQRFGFLPSDTPRSSSGS